MMMMMSNRTIAIIACLREKMRALNVTSTFRHVHTTVQYASNAFPNVIITAFGWIVALVNRIIGYFLSAAVWAHFPFYLAQTYH